MKKKQGWLGFFHTKCRFIYAVAVSCSHVAAKPEGAVRISITDTERSARQIADDFVKLGTQRFKRF